MHIECAVSSSDGVECCSAARSRRRCWRSVWPSTNWRARRLHLPRPQRPLLERCPLRPAVPLDSTAERSHVHRSSFVCTLVAPLRASTLYCSGSGWTVAPFPQSAFSLILCVLQTYKPTNLQTFSPLVFSCSYLSFI